MRTTILNRAENLARSIARWGSVVAALVFGVGFVTDPALSWHVVSAQLLLIGLNAALFFGSALAWVQRSEVLGSVFAVFSTIAVYVAYSVMNPPPLVRPQIGRFAPSGTRIAPFRTVATRSPFSCAQSVPRGRVCADPHSWAGVTRASGRCSCENKSQPGHLVLGTSAGHSPAPLA